MSWIKKLFQKFKSDDEDYEDIEESVDYETEIYRERMRKQPDTNKDVEAKVLYQYPKGKFRFPLIPDVPAEQDERPERKYRNVQEDVKAQNIHTPRVQKTRRQEPSSQPEEPRQIYKPKPAPQAPAVNITTKKETRPNFSKRPFRPTEIPSPIYGYGKPKKVEEVIEVELDGISIGINDVTTEPQFDQSKIVTEVAVGLSPELDKVETPRMDVLVPIILNEQEKMRDEGITRHDSTVDEDIESKNLLNKDYAEKIDTNYVDQFSNAQDSEEVLNRIQSVITDEVEYNGPQNIFSNKVPYEKLPDEVHLKQQPVVNDVKEQGYNLDVTNNNELQNYQTEIAVAPESKNNLNEQHQEHIDPNIDSVHVFTEETIGLEVEQTLQNVDIVVSESVAIPESGQEIIEEAIGLEVEQTLQNVDVVVSESVAIPESGQEIIEEAIGLEVEQTLQNVDVVVSESVAIPESGEETIKEAIELEVEQILQNKDAAVAESAETRETGQEIIPNESTTPESESHAAISSETEAELEPVRPKRAHLPFNVLMLKQDKRYLEQMNRFTKPVNQAPAKQVIENDESIQVLDMSKEEVVPTNPIGQGDNFGQVTPSHIEQVNNNSTTQLSNELIVANQPSRDLENHSIGLVNEERNETELEEYQIENYVFPAYELLEPPVIVESNSEWMLEQEHLLNETLKNFNVGAKVVNVTQGPSVTRFEIQPEPGVKVNKITNLSDDIKLSLAAKDIRMEAPIPGKHTIGIEVPNGTSRPVLISEIINSPEFLKSESPLTAILGLDIAGKPIVTDLRKMPHGLIAGATGSGKSVCINTILVSLLYKANPDELKLLLIDPKMVELAPYNFIPHLVSPVITDVKAATAALKWAVEEMERRYELFAHTGVRDISRFNQIAEEHKRYSDKLPYIVIVIDELADLMMMSPADVEEAICRIAQKARACGIHLIIATQRPSVDVITGLIKANVPTRIAFSVSSQVDSRTIIDISGAERLLGRGDMLFLENGSSKPVRLQGTFVSDLEIDDVVAHVRKERKPEYLFEQEELLKKAQISEEEDELFYEACEFVIAQGGASTSSIQRRFKVGYNRAARLIDMMEKQGFISEARGSKPRDVLITEDELESILVQ